METFITSSAKETEKLGEKLAKRLSERIFALIGELGSGKTTFVKGFAKGLGIKKRIISPSFVFIRQYKIQSSIINHQSFLYHVDLYRLEKPSDAKGLGLEEIWSNPDNMVIIEWAEKIKRLLPKKRIEIYFEYLGKNQRKITVEQ